MKQRRVCSAYLLHQAALDIPHDLTRCFPMRALRTLVLLLCLAAFTDVERSVAQSLDVPVEGYGLSIGDSPWVNGLRINFRDRNLRRVNGVNLTIWTPRSPASGTVNGVALGVPMTGARRIRGLAVGIIGAGADETITGVALGPVGVGSGRSIEGLGIGGIGIGAGGDLIGVGIGGLGAGAGADVTGIMVGGLGVGAGDDITGIMIGGLGVGGGGDVLGLGIGGLGVGAGGSVTGVAFGGLGVGGGGDMTGLMVGGLGVGGGGTMQGLFVGGVGVGGPKIVGAVLAGAVAGGERITGGVIAPAYFQITEEGRLTGFSLSAFNHIKGEQNGFTLGLLNYARYLNGVQVGLLNFAGNKRHGLRWLPFINWHFD
ncbi:MAG: hypothetical protein ACE5G0_09170 [Rhodothermales bacterium]